jgi:hypothetical protein
MSSDNQTERESWGRLILRVLRSALLTALGLGAAALIVCWLIGWRALYLMGQGLLIAGLGSIALGLLSTVGTWNVRGSFGYQFSRSVSHQQVGERTSQDVHDLFGSNAFMITTLLAGILLILLGSLLQQI